MSSFEAMCQRYISITMLQTLAKLMSPVESLTKAPFITHLPYERCHFPLV